MNKEQLKEHCYQELALYRGNLIHLLSDFDRLTKQIDRLIEMLDEKEKGQSFPDCP